VNQEVEFPRKTKFKKVIIPMFEKRDIFVEMSTFRNINRNRKKFKKSICLEDIDSLSWTMVEYRNISEKIKMEFKLRFGMIWCRVNREMEEVVADHLMKKLAIYNNGNDRKGKLKGNQGPSNLPN
jgi:hypothetical protein